MKEAARNSAATLEERKEQIKEELLAGKTVEGTKYPFVNADLLEAIEAGREKLKERS
jgi:hypothetical protein